MEPETPVWLASVPWSGPPKDTLWIRPPPASPPQACSLVPQNRGGLIVIANRLLAAARGRRVAARASVRAWDVRSVDPLATATAAAARDDERVARGADRAAAATATAGRADGAEPAVAAAEVTAAAARAPGDGDRAVGPAASDEEGEDLAWGHGYLGGDLPAARSPAALIALARDWTRRCRPRHPPPSRPARSPRSAPCRSDSRPCSRTSGWPRRPVPDGRRSRPCRGPARAPPCTNEPAHGKKPRMWGPRFTTVTTMRHACAPRPVHREGVGKTVGSPQSCGSLSSRLDHRDRPCRHGGSHLDAGADAELPEDPGKAAPRPPSA